MSFRLLLICVALGVAVAAAAPASAHPAGAAAARAASAPIAESPEFAAPRLETTSGHPGAEAPLVLALMILVGLSLLAARHDASRLVALSVLLLLGGFEGARHSAHHLDDASAQCRVASSAEHVSVIQIEAPRIRVPSILTIESLSPERHAPVRPAELTSAAGRAPPV